MKNIHLTTVPTSLLLSPKLGKYVLIWTPDFNFLLKRSHLFRKRIIVALERSFEVQTIRHRRKESSSRLTLESSERRSSKQDTAVGGYVNIKDKFQV